MSLEAFLRHVRNALIVMLVGGALVLLPAMLSLWGMRSLAQPWTLLVPLAVWIVTLALWWRVFTALLPNVWREGGLGGGLGGGARGRRKRYLCIDPAQIGAYQRFFDEAVDATDAENLQRVRSGDPHLSDTLAEDLAHVDAVAVRAAAEGLNADYVRTMFEQWVWADPTQRAAARASWVATVRRRRRDDFFPSARVVADRRELWERLDRTEAAAV